MIILTRKVFCFVNQETNQSREAAKKFVTKGSMTMEEAPDWIKNDPLFQWAKDDGDIIIAESNIVKAEAAAVATAAATVATAAEAAAASIETAAAPTPAKAEAKGKK